MREHGAGDSPLGWRGIPSRTQTQVCISAPFLSFARSGPVLSVSRSEEHTSELQSLMRISYAVFCLKKKKQQINQNKNNKQQELNTTLVYKYIVKNNNINHYIH